MQSWLKLRWDNKKHPLNILYNKQYMQYNTPHTIKTLKCVVAPTIMKYEGGWIPAYDILLCHWITCTDAQCPMSRIEICLIEYEKRIGIQRTLYCTSLGTTPVSFCCNCSKTSLGHPQCYVSWLQRQRAGGRVGGQKGVGHGRETGR